ncbi:MAG: glycosyltransferase, partial [Patescibacteria group bacterium]|nr:glycosyltransferase [Patescibacteria group bacterium]
MRIGIDARVLAEGNGGVFVYAKNIISRMASLGSGHDIHLFANQYKRTDGGEIDRLRLLPNVFVHQYRFPNKFLNASFRFRRWPNIDDLVGGCDVLFFPSMMYSSWSAKTKTVLTMHDLSYEFFPEFFTVRQQLWHRLMDPKALCKRADRIIAVSGSTAKDVVNHYAIPEKKVATIHSGIDAAFRAVVDRATLESARTRYG